MSKELHEMCSIFWVKNTSWKRNSKIINLLKPVIQTYDVFEHNDCEIIWNI